MVRTRKEDEHAAKRNEILDTALKLVYSKGYGRMTIQDILDQLQISKGAFYHYFDSKAAVLEALVERMATQQVEPLLISTVNNPHLTALEKLHAYFDTAVRWKTAEKAFVMELIKVWYSDENALARQKMYKLLVAHAKPWFVQIIRQGAREGVFTTPYPNEASQVTIDMIQGLGDKFAEMLLVTDADADEQVDQARMMLAAYNDAIERILGAPKGSIRLMDPEGLRVWFSPDEGRPAAAKASRGKIDISESSSL